MRIIKMLSPMHSKRLILVHHRQTGEVEIRRTGDLSRGSGSPSSPSALASQHLHFTDDKLSHVCRCPSSRSHKQSSPVALASTHLAQDLTRYLDEHGLDKCSVDTFRNDQQLQRDLWACEDIFVNDFHYATKQKDVVCRCTKPNNHGREVIRNTEIQELCVLFFRSHPNKMTCTKDQWRMATKSAQADDILNNAPLPYKQPSLGPSADSGLREMVDIPSKVWENARPSVWNVRSKIVSSRSTPLGSPVAAQLPQANFLESINQHTTLDVPRRDSTSTSWSTIQRQAAVGAAMSLEDELKLLSVAGGTDEPFTYVLDHIEAREPQPQVVSQAQPLPRGLIPSSPHVKTLNLSRNGNKMSTTRLQVSSQSLDVPVILSELSAHDTRVELATKTPCPELPGKVQGAAVRYPAEFSDLEDIRRDSPLDYTSEYLQLLENLEHSTCSSKSETKQGPGNLATLFRQVTNALDLPNQEDFLLRHVTVFSRAQPAPLNDCVLCTESLIHRQKRTLQLHCCGQFLHETCLVADFRFRDEALGRCPICSMAMCKRDLADRLDTDRKAIFGTGFTEIHDIFCMSFPHRNDSAHLKSEEELASAQLRLLKDIVQAHADDILGKWEFDSHELGWYTDVIRPSVKLWKGWNSSYSPSRYFTDRDAFLNLLAWAELVRLVNHARSTLQQAPEVAVQLPLADLHWKFEWAKGRFEREKKTWKLNQSGVLDCEMIAQDFYDMAMRTHHSSPP